VCDHRSVEQDEARRELEATLAAREELGRDYEHHLVESFLDKVEQGLVRRRHELVPPDHHGVRTPALLGSIGVGIPVTAIALSNSPGAGGVVVAIVAWVAIGAANVAFWRR
jgi:hypothetical protein